MKLLNPRGNMIKISFRTAKSGHNITSSWSLTDWNESRSSRRAVIQGKESLHRGLDLEFWFSCKYFF